MEPVTSKLDKKTKVLLISILQSGEATKEQKQQLADFLGVQMIQVRVVK